MKPPIIASALGIILIAFGGIIISPALVAVIEGEYFSTLPFSVASGFAIGLGLLCRFYGGGIKILMVCGELKAF